MLGHVDDVVTLLEDHDVLVHCSTVPEPFGQVIVQGLAAGIPVVATDAGGPREILEGAPTSLRYPVGSPVGLTEAVAAARIHYSQLSLWSSRRAVTYSDDVLLARADGLLRHRAQGTMAEGMETP